MNQIMYMEGKKNWLDEGEKGLKTEFYKLSSDGWHVEFIESISYKVDDSGQKDYYRNKNGEYKISWELYSLISEEYPIRSVVGSCRRKPCLTLMKRYWKQKGNRSIKNIQP